MTVERVYEGKRVTHWRCSRPRGEPVTVRCSDFGVYCCLTCRSIDCEHAHAVEAHDRSRAQPGA